MIELGVNIDHVATVRQARRTYEPDPIIAAGLAEQGGADGITFHLREDRRHIQDRDVEILVQTVTVKTNFELACADDVIAICCRVKPDWALLVPESREEVTTEGGLDAASDSGRIRSAIEQLKAQDIQTSLFLDPDLKQVEAAVAMGLMRSSCTPVRTHWPSERASKRNSSVWRLPAKPFLRRACEYTRGMD